MSVIQFHKHSWWRVTKCHKELSQETPSAHLSHNSQVQTAIQGAQRERQMYHSPYYNANICEVAASPGGTGGRLVSDLVSGVTAGDSTRSVRARLSGSRIRPEPPRDLAVMEMMEGDVMDKLEDMSSVYDFDPITGNIPATKVEITVSCRNLLDKDTFSKSDPLCVLYTQGVETKQWREFGRTEVIDNTLNPDFVRKYILDYFFEEKQSLRFDLYDVDSKSPDLSKHDFLGQMFCTLGEIVGSPASRLEKPLGPLLCNGR
ncbi:copine-5b isoform X4 [Acanthopagrus latus]|uniref:copine-5b isoform X4 n=1 Tax=Acanthopagrus latus TaxID=8177 RepID=UPI00187BD003|nr:copine-5b isoform X4 [Acanthopagrus latus]